MNICTCKIWCEQKERRQALCACFCHKDVPKSVKPLEEINQDYIDNLRAIMEQKRKLGAKRKKIDDGLKIVHDPGVEPPDKYTIARDALMRKLLDAENDLPRILREKGIDFFNEQ